jgi:hypothetical protein
MYWASPFVVGCLIGAGVVAGGWLLPAFLPTALVAEMLLPAYRMPELADRFVPEVLAAMQAAFAVSGLACLLCFAGWGLLTFVVVRPKGPGEVARGWRWVLWWALLALALAVTYSAVRYWLAWQLDTVDGVWAIRIALIVMAAMAVNYWIMSFFGAERMMRPAVPLASLR